jgi:hypothetical protein
MVVNTNVMTIGPTGIQYIPNPPAGTPKPQPQGLGQPGAGQIVIQTTEIAGQPTGGADIMVYNGKLWVKVSIEQNTSNDPGNVTNPAIIAKESYIMGGVSFPLNPGKQ